MWLELKMVRRPKAKPVPQWFVWFKKSQLSNMLFGQ